jgi:hypothetical protein
MNPLEFKQISIFQNLGCNILFNNKQLAMNICDKKSISYINEVACNVYLQVMTHHDVNTLHMDDVYGPHILSDPLTIHMQFATSFHFCN